ncbi:MAG TPA: metal-sulfur cluster assembly factor [Kiritimatiellia bacterium]|nr:metal-sulfur cluster assembly factor [Kiritimatiellia bacterium]
MTDEQEKAAAPEYTETVVWTPEQIREILKTVIDPELHINIVDLGLVYGVVLKEDEVEVSMTLTSPGCPYGPYLLHVVKDTLVSLKGIRDAQIKVVWEPPWGPDKMTEEVRLQLGFDV